MEQSFERMRPEQVQQVLAEAPVAYVPMGTLEWHGWHLPLGFDALKAQALCKRAATETGGVVLPPAFFGYGGGHRPFLGSIISEETLVEGNLRITLERLIEMGFRVLVVVTGHYPGEQVDLVARVVEEVLPAHPEVDCWVGPEYAAYPDFPDDIRADHAARWETSLGLALLPELTDLAAFEGKEDPLYGIYGEDPRTTASLELGEETASGIVSELVNWVRDSLSQP